MMKGTLAQGQRWAGGDMDGDTGESDRDVDTDTVDWNADAGANDGLTWGPTGPGSQWRGLWGSRGGDRQEGQGG